MGEIKRGEVGDGDYLIMKWGLEGYLGHFPLLLNVKIQIWHFIGQNS